MGRNFWYRLSLILLLFLPASSQTHIPSTITDNAYFKGAPVVDVMSFGCKANGVTDDQACFQNAINYAKTLSSYSGTGYGAVVKVGCGKYAIGSPIVKPRVPLAGKAVGIVPLVGVSENCVVLVGLSSFTTAPATLVLLNGGSGYSNSPSCSLSGGGGTGLGCTATASNGVVATIALTGSVAAPYTSMPTVSITDGTGTGAYGLAIGHGIIEWDQTSSARVIEDRIENMQIVPPPVQGTVSILYQVSATNTPVTQTGAIAERQDRLQLNNLEFQSNNQYNPADIYIQGDCLDCYWHDNTDNAALAPVTDNYETTLYLTDICPPTGNVGDEACGNNFGLIQNSVSGATRGGFSAVYQGRANRITFTSAFCDGGRGGFNNSQCYAFYNSTGNKFEHLNNEGRGESPQILLNNSTDNTFDGIGLGTPNDAGSGIGDGMDFINSSRNYGIHSVASKTAGQSWQTLSGGSAYKIKMDANSHNNQLYDIGQTGTTDLSVSDTSTNYIQWCNYVTGCAAGYSSTGTKQ